MKISQQKNAITFPKGFLASGLHCGIKKKKSLKDLGLLVSKVPAKTAACFTTNRVKAWPVQYCQKVIKNPAHRAILANSGNANCMTGQAGKEVTAASIAFLANELGISKKFLLIASTGVIGKLLDVNHIVCSIPELCSKLSVKGGHHAAQSILTTDTITKELTASFKIGNKTIRLGAMAKGAGMVKPNMATTLIFITTDLAITKGLLQTALKKVTEKTFNCMSIDNDPSTNDTVFLMANGLAGNKTVTQKDRHYLNFEKALFALCEKLTKLLLADGEGVGRLCEIRISGAKTEAQAKLAASAIADSMLFKTALAGADPNWGRVVAALGANPKVSCNFHKMNLQFGSTVILKNGQPVKYNKKQATKEFAKKEVFMKVDLKKGKAGTTFWTTDLTKEYVRINSEYTT